MPKCISTSNFVKICHMVASCKDIKIFRVFKMAANLDHPRRVLGSLYHSAKFGKNRYSSFENMEVSIFGTNGWKTPIYASNIGVLGILLHKCGAIWTKPQRVHPCVSPRCLSNQT